MTSARPGSGGAPYGGRRRRSPVIKVLPPEHGAVRRDAAVMPRKDSLSTERTRAKIIVTLTLACTVLSLYDLYLLMVVRLADAGPAPPGAPGILRLSTRDPPGSACLCRRWSSTASASTWSASSRSCC